MVQIDRTSPWTKADMAAVGMIEPDADDTDRNQCRDWLVYASNARRGQSFLHWEQLRGIGQFLDIALAHLHDAVIDDGADYDPVDAYAVAVTEIQVIFGVRQRQARNLVDQSVAVSESVPRVGELLRDALITPEMFAIAVARTAIVLDADTRAAVDADLAAALRSAGQVSEKVATGIADRVVARHDPDAVRRRREKAKARRNVTARDYEDGLGGLTITADAEEARLAWAAVNALAESVCPADPRPLGVRRSAAATARLRRLPFECGCPDKSTCTAHLDEDALSERQARVVIHAVCQKSTLDGADDEPGYLDGHGVIGADHVREMARRADACVRDLDLDQFGAPEDLAESPILIERTAQPAEPYRPTAALDTLVRGLFPTCTVPGCVRPAWSCELDHVEEYNQVCPASGGPTCLCNIATKCKFHHVQKTSVGAADPAAGFVDDLWIDDDGSIWTAITTPHGITVEAPAPGQWLFPQLEGVKCLHQPHAPPESHVSPESAPAPPLGGGLRAATAYKHAWRRAERARLRRRRDQAAADDPPPF
ncbi:13E12 repeat family protein [Gordonia alkaliphila]|uniref:DUF222 domain-containing protein n=1 Tax=Gordonia alkaliphila TaxID=1053547 RepID=UPI001FF21D5F|nr:DUF222 domain-containing protein [Gordonia alkaliphila]MCK0440847.1 13E12 repeat family protein [Gordonia alkaliphila]